MTYFPLTFVTYPGAGDFVGMHWKPITVQIAFFTPKKMGKCAAAKNTSKISVIILDGAKVGAEL